MTTLPHDPNNQHDYRIATGLRGFPSDILRVRVLDIRDGYAWVVTADLIDAGTPLTLNASQVVSIAAVAR